MRHKARFFLPGFTFELAISTFSVNVRSAPTTAAALSYSERLALAAVGRGTSRASNDHAAARFRARRRDCGGGLLAGPAQSPSLGHAQEAKRIVWSSALKTRCCLSRSPPQI